MHAENKFYGDSSKYGKTLKERKAMRPGPGESEKSFLAKGGIIGELSKQGIVWNEDTLSFQSTAYDSDIAFKKWKESQK